MEQYSFALTIRQIYYRLVATQDYDKTENAYATLCEKIGRARRAEMISMSAIRDDGFIQKVPTTYEDAEDFLETVHNAATFMRFDRQRGQQTRLVVWCEAGGMVPQLEMVAEDFGVPVYSSGGFDSITAKHKVAEEFAEWGSVEVLHVGDYDPSGVHMFSSLEEDIKEFAWAYGCTDVEFTRLAVTPDQIRYMSLPSAPVKKSDNREFDGDATVQCEAIDPNVFNEIVRDAITSRMDAEIYDAVVALESIDRESVLGQLKAE